MPSRMMNRDEPLIPSQSVDIRSSLGVPADAEPTLTRHKSDQIRSLVGGVGSSLADELTWKEKDASTKHKLRSAETINGDTSDLIKDEDLWNEFKARLEKSGHITSSNTKELLAQFLAEKKALQTKAAQDRARDVTDQNQQQGEESGVATETTDRRRSTVRSLSDGIRKRLSFGSIEDALGGIEKSLKEEECTPNNEDESAKQQQRPRRGGKRRPIQRSGSDSLFNYMANLADESSTPSQQGESQS